MMVVLLAFGVLILWIISNAGSLEKIYSWLTAGARKKDEAIDKRFEDMAAELATLVQDAKVFVDADTLEKRFSGHDKKLELHGAALANQENINHENTRERERIKGEVMGQLQSIHKDMLLLEPMPNRVISLETKYESLKADMNRLQEGQQEIKSDMRANKQEIKEGMKENKAEILAAIAEMKHRS